MRYIALLLVIVVGTVTGALAYHDFSLGPPVVLAAPSGPQMTPTGTSVLPNGWTNAPSLEFRAKAEPGTTAQLDVEVRPEGSPFTDTPTATSSDATADPSLTLHLPDGRYHWQMRLHGDRGVSPWVAQRSAIKIDTSKPSVMELTSPTHPDPAKTYHTSTATFHWQASDTGSDIAGYSYRLDSDAKGEARAELRTQQPTVTLSGLETGQWYIHVRALDHAGNWGPSHTFPVHIDVTPPGLAHVRFSLFKFDPQFDPLNISFQVTRSASSFHVGVYRQRDNAEVRLFKVDGLPKGRSTTVTWNGKDNHGRQVPSGTYSVYIRAIDKYGHSSLTGWKDFVVDYRRILVSLSQQKMWAYDGNRLVVSSLVTTGNRELPTPTGTFHVLGKFSPFTFKSPWPKSSKFYYAPSKVSYALLFREGGYFLHDAPWRTAFGPGTNAAIGTPGQNFTGTHGCVNVPPGPMHKLYYWAREGTVVQVVP